jgi:hypothetical protein
MKVRVVGYYTPETEEQDPNNKTGLTAEAYERLMESLIELEIESITKVHGSA